jgi:hypothetical protein
MDSLFAYLCDIGLVDDLENLVVGTGMVDESAWLIQCAWCLQEQGLPYRSWFAWHLPISSGSAHTGSSFKTG